ncbi:MAG: matrixin family metalloprotease [Deltaproteobacteria bacterium]|nr:matrixin family metalloprotease [Deltaproteobacteria bacterium]
MGHRGIVGSLILGAVVAAAAHATTFVDLDAAALAGRSQAVVYGRVSAVEAVDDTATQGVWTNVTIVPDTVVAGSLRHGPIVLRELGGDFGDHSERIIGAATYAVGERVLVFLQRRQDGSYATTDMALGKFEVSSDGSGNRTATRRFEADVALFDPHKRSLRVAPPPSSQSFDEVVAAAQSVFKAAGRPIQTPAPADVNGLDDYQAPFVLMGNARWFEADNNLPVTYLVDGNGTVGLGPTVSRAAIDDALAIWTTAPAAPLVLADGGTTTAQAFAGCTGTNNIIFNDPFNEISNPSGCGGILAIGGYCTSGQTTVHNGVTFNRITHGKVTFNDGWEACGLWTPCDLAEVATHELGHTIGLGHSLVSSATMAPVAHFDGRCAGLKPDDIAGANFIYGKPATDLVMMPRPVLNVTFAVGETQTIAKLAVTVRNSDQPSTGVAQTAHLIASDGDCPAGTVGTPNFGKSALSTPDTATVKPGGKRTAKIPLTFNSAAINTPNLAAPQRCTVHLSVDALGSEGEDLTPDNNVLDVPIDVVDPSDDTRGQSPQLQNTVLNAVAPIHIGVKSGVGGKLVQRKFVLRNVDVGTFASHTVQMTTSDGNCPAGTMAGVSLPNDLPTVSIPQGKKRSGHVSISIDANQFTTLKANSPARCTASLSVQPLGGETDLSNNTVPVVIDVVDGNDY